MAELRHRFRSVGIALTVLAITAGVAFAAAGPGSSHASLTAATGADASETPEGSETPDGTETPEGSETPDTAEASTDTHGALVSAAAQMVTPAGFANHGAFVSCVAHMKDATLATIDWSTITRTSCAAAGHGKAHSHSH